MPFLENSFLFDILDIGFFGLCCLFIYDRCSAESADLFNLVSVGFVALWVGLRVCANAQNLLASLKKKPKPGALGSRK